MKHQLALAILLAGAAAAPALAQGACPWAGGAYKFSEHGFYGDYTVNADCTEMVWSRLSDGPEVTALERVDEGWQGQIKEITVLLLDGGNHLRITDASGVSRQPKAKRTN